MRIGLGIETDSPGGAETMLLELARELLARGHDVFALGPKSGAGWLTGRFADMGIERDAVIGPVGARGIYGLQNVFEIAAAARRRRLDILHSHEFAMAVQGAVAGRIAGYRHIITMHGGDYYTRRPRRRAALRLAAALSDHTVAVSDALRSSLASALGRAPTSIDLVHNGAAPVGGSDVLRSELDLRDDQVLALAVGSLYEVKGHAILIDALAKLPSLSDTLVLAIAGSGYEEPKLRALAARLGVEGQVHLLGYRSDVPDLLQSADIFVMPSLSEGLPMAMIEAMLAAKPILASNVGGIPELISGSDIGLLSKPGDAVELADHLKRLSLDPPLRARLGVAARVRAASGFTASSMAERYLALYDDDARHASRASVDT